VLTKLVRLWKSGFTVVFWQGEPEPFAAQFLDARVASSDGLAVMSEFPFYRGFAALFAALCWTYMIQEDGFRVE
jgi:hypothetical protein